MVPFFFPGLYINTSIPTFTQLCHGWLLIATSGCQLRQKVDDCGNWLLIVNCKDSETDIMTDIPGLTLKENEKKRRERK